MEQSGIIFNIQRCSLHDGDGIRTNIFFKGCPICCKWCSNPESQNFYPEISISEGNCIGCGFCREACPAGALKPGSWDRELCISCRKCESVCPAGALELSGRSMTVDEVVYEVMKDQSFYHISGGGVTFSGGEPMSQYIFAEALARKLKGLFIHLAIETSGHAKWEHIEKVLVWTDQILFDIKHMDPAIHRKWIGEDNTLILENAAKIASLGKELIIRVPVIGGINADYKNLRETALFAKKIGVKELHLLPYHRFGEAKYAKINRKYECMDAFTLEDDKMKLQKKFAEGYGLKVNIGG